MIWKSKYRLRNQSIFLILDIITKCALPVLHFGFTLFIIETWTLLFSSINCLADQKTNLSPPMGTQTSIFSISLLIVTDHGSQNKIKWIHRVQPTNAIDENKTNHYNISKFDWNHFIFRLIWIDLSEEGVHLQILAYHEIFMHWTNK